MFRSFLDAAYRVARAWLAAEPAPAKKCQYCPAAATCRVQWFRGAFGGPGKTVPYCGACSLKDALARRGMTAPVEEGEDYDILPAEKVPTTWPSPSARRHPAPGDPERMRR